MRKLLISFACDETAATAVEYAFVVGLLSIASVLAWENLGSTLQAAFRSVSNDIELIRRG